MGHGGASGGSTVTHNLGQTGHTALPRAPTLIALLRSSASVVSGCTAFYALWALLLLRRLLLLLRVWGLSLLLQVWRRRRLVQRLLLLLSSSSTRSRLPALTLLLRVGMHTGWVLAPMLCLLLCRLLMQRLHALHLLDLPPLLVLLVPRLWHTTANRLPALLGVLLHPHPHPHAWPGGPLLLLLGRPLVV